MRCLVLHNRFHGISPPFASSSWSTARFQPVFGKPVVSCIFSWSNLRAYSLPGHTLPLACHTENRHKGTSADQNVVDMWCIVGPCRPPTHTHENAFFASGFASGWMSGFPDPLGSSFLAFAAPIIFHIASILKSQAQLLQNLRLKNSAGTLRNGLSVIPYLQGVLHLESEKKVIHWSSTKAKSSKEFLVESSTKFVNAFCFRGMLSNPWYQVTRWFSNCVKQQQFMPKHPGVFPGVTLRFKALTLGFGSS